MEILKSFFRFTSKERLAILLLCLLMVIFWLLPLFFPEKPPKIGMAQPQPAATGSTRDSLFNREGRGANDGGPLIDGALPNKYAASPNTKKRSYFYFNPNTISSEQWRSLGLRDKTILTIQHYLQKGGRFKKPEDLRKIWGLKAWEADVLIPFVQIPAPDPTIPATSFVGEAGGVNNTGGKVQTEPAYQPKTWQLAPIEINEASPEQWMSFPGIGSVLAARIVKFREKIGGFTSIDQVGKTYGIKDSLFQLMKPLLILENLPKKKE